MSIVVSMLCDTGRFIGEVYGSTVNRKVLQYLVISFFVHLFIVFLNYFRYHIPVNKDDDNDDDMKNTQVPYPATQVTVPSTS